MSRHHVWGLVLVLMLILTAAGFWALLFPSPRDASRAQVSAQRAADFVHAAVQAGRRVYQTHVVEHLEGRRVAKATRHWQTKGGVPLPEQFVLAAGRLAEAQGVHYRLVSLTPINERNEPRSELERQGLEAVSRNPATPFQGTMRQDGKQYFQAIYPEVAASQECVDCHASAVRAAGKQYRVGDVLGGLVITIPLYE